MTELSITPKRIGRTLPNLHDKTKADARERKRNILYLIRSYLAENKFSATAEALENEAPITGEYQVCENIDLEIILQEYQSYYYTKFQKYPKIVRKIDTPTTLSCPNKKTHVRIKTAQCKNKDNSISQSESEEFPFEIISLSNEKSADETVGEKTLDCPETYSNEWKEVANQIMKDFIPKHPQEIAWRDCIGLGEAAEKLKEAMIYPLTYPDLFKNVPTWKGVLLFGPPGTGKTLLAKALASEVSTFINVTSSSFISKWRGESEKMIKVLFDLARNHAPTTIFIDEIDSLAVASETSQHEASRRFKSELLVQLDGILSSESNVFILGSTNRPWTLDPALLRRFEKRILVPLPDEHGKFSGSDIKTLCKEVSMTCVREKISEITLKGSNKTRMELRPATVADVEKALEKINPCSREVECKKYFEWNVKFGSW
ncbi:hypothetical protein JTB14_005720 [Gonioctena quinquepunctata]|nr:hypothetical protein JTB14_005720 [Gonioctena quinquepunctata]